LTGFTDITITGNIQNAREVLQQVFQQRNFIVKWNDDYSAKTTRGSKWLDIVFGPLFQYHEIDIQISVEMDKTISVRLINRNSGWTGGLIGTTEVKETYQEMVNLVSSYFNYQGVYRGRYPL
jgi:hypothetical protein